MKVWVAAVVVIAPLIAAAWLIPPDFPMLIRQILLAAWGVGAILVAELLLFSNSLGTALRAVGFVPARARALIVALAVSIPMWVFLPTLARFRGVPVALHPDWLTLLIGVVLVNGITEEVIHRGFF